MKKTFKTLKPILERISINNKKYKTETMELAKKALRVVREWEQEFYEQEASVIVKSKGSRKQLNYLEKEMEGV